MSTFAVHAARKNLKDANLAVHKCAVDDLNEIDDLDRKLRRVTAIPLFRIKYAEQLPLGFRLFFEIASSFYVPRFREMMHLVRYEV